MRKSWEKRKKRSNWHRQISFTCKCINTKRELNFMKWFFFARALPATNCVGLWSAREIVENFDALRATYDNISIDKGGRKSLHYLLDDVIPFALSVERWSSTNWALYHECVRWIIKIFLKVKCVSLSMLF